MNAAWLELARARPSKKSTNGTLPPITATAPSPDQLRRTQPRRRHRRGAGRQRSPMASPSRTIAATRFLAVV